MKFLVGLVRIGKDFVKIGRGAWALLTCEYGPHSTPNYEGIPKILLSRL